MNEAVENVTDNTEVTSKQEETKAEKFIRLGEYRMNKAMDAIGRLEHLANKSAYEYTPEQVEAMFSTLELRGGRCKSKIYGNENKGKCNFFLWDKGRVGRIRRWVSHRYFRRKVDDNKIPDDLHNGGGNRQRDCKK